MRLELDDNFIGNRIEIAFLNTMPAKDIYISQFTEFKDDNHIIISTPIKGGNVLKVDFETRLFVYFIFKYDLYRFKAKVVNKFKKNDIYYLEIEMIESFENIQRREFYRFKTVLDIEIERFEHDLKETFKCNVNDLSGGGICATTNKLLKLSETVNGTLFLKDGNKIIFKGKVVRVSELLGKLPGNQYGIRYLDITNKDREIIIKYIFYEELKLRKKGLI